MKLHLDGKHVLVTGGSKGIGKAIVESFAAEGAHVHFCSRSQGPANETQRVLRTKYPNVTIDSAIVDIASPASVSAWVSGLAEQHPIDVVVSNVSALAIPNTPENWDAAYTTDMKALYTLAAAAEPHLDKSKGNLIAISSVSGREVDFTAPGPYGAFKAAVVHYTAQLSRAWAPRGMRANTVSPGNIYIADGVWGGIERDSPNLFAAQMKANPTGRMGKAEEIADAVVFLASPRSSFTSGANLVIDGSLVAGVQF
ncbi:Carbonyl reductase family member 4 [Sphaceloma murrayae]|uniref:Carbonyl reductase family member 4 n=1 Tax=Sphaceloma murrayae TaxID=2082308 RepID=A0A2K1R3F5_9PEZI|nr:Carbonyl reductase family member 4 [Sphaceloma murrayae]